MAVSYKGLTIKFGGDTSELQDALKKIQKSSKDTQADLKAIEKALKFNPGNTDLLEQKVRKLNAAYDETKDRLDAYKQALQKLEEKKQRGEQLTEEEQRQYDSLKREILKCENQLESYTDQLKRTNTEMEASQTALYKFGQKLEDNAESLGKAGDAMEKVGGIMVGVSTAVTGASLAAFDEVDAGFDNVIKATGATGEAAQDLQKSVENVAGTLAGAQYGWDAIGSTVGEVNTRFKVTGDELDTLTENFFQFSTITGVDSVAAVQDVSKAMTAFGTDASKTDEVLGVVAKTAQDTGISADYLLNSLVANGSTFRELGLDIDDATVMLGRFEAAGVPADQMLAGLKKAAANCADSGEDLSTMLTDLTERLKDPATAAEATQEAIDLFGSKAAMTFIDAAKSGRVNFSDLEQTLDEFGGVVGSTFDETSDGIDQSKVAMKELQAAGAELGGEIGEVLAPILSDLAGFVRDAKEAFAALTPEQKEFAAKAVLAVGAVGGLVMGFGKLLGAAGQIGSAFKGLATGWTSFTGVLAANPIMLGVAAVAAAAAGLTWFFTQTETGKQMWADFTSWISEKWQGVQDFFAGVPEFWSGIWDNVTGAVDTAKTTLETAWTGLQTAATEKFDAIKQTISDDMTAAQEAGSHASSALQAAMSGDWATAQSEALACFDTIKARIGEKMESLKTSVSNIVDRIGEKLGFPGLSSKIAGIFDGIKNSIRDKINAAKEAVTGAIDRIKSAFNFHISWPHIPLPHFNWHMQSIGGILSLPVFDGISWYAKGNGVFDPNHPQLIGVGDNKTEREYLNTESQLRNVVEAAVRGAGGSGSVAVNVNVNATITGRTSAYEIGQQIGRGVQSTLKQRGKVGAYA